MILLVSEKPSVAVQHYIPMLERVLGESFVKKDGYFQGTNYVVSWCVGHLVTLAGFEEYDEIDKKWSMKNLPLLPEKFKLKKIETTKKQLKILLGLMKKSEVIINGADAGREGNLIFDLVVDVEKELGKKTLKRLWTNSFTPKELDLAWRKLESWDKRKTTSYAAKARQQADWLLGLNCTRAYTCKANSLLSVGRVQTPTLGLIVERDRIIEEFKEAFSFGLQAKGESWEALALINGDEKFVENENLANEKIKGIKRDGWKVEKVEVKEKKKFPPKPFDLTELQKEANKSLKLTAQKTLGLTQKLYEMKYVTYPRTDSEYLTEGMKEEAYDLAVKMATDEQRKILRKGDEKFGFVNSKKVTDHYAIIPTGEKVGNLEKDEKALYLLIKNRFITAWMKPKVWDEKAFEIVNEGIIFQGRVNSVKDNGFVKEKEEGEGVFPGEVGEFLKAVDAGILKRKSSKPKYYTEATLLTAMKGAGRQLEGELSEAMKERGLGTPATQASIIETLKKRKYIEDSKGNLKSSKVGKQLIDLVSPKLRDAVLTGEWEFKLNLIEKGEMNPREYIREIEEYVEGVFEEIAQMGSLEIQEDNASIVQCPKCKNRNLKILNWGMGCVKECGFGISKVVAKKTLSQVQMEAVIKGEGKFIKGFEGKNGNKFEAKLVMNELFKADFVFAQRVVVGECIKCGSRFLRGEKTFFCEVKECDFSIWKVVAGLSLTDKMIKELMKNKETGEIKGFLSKAKKPFSAKLILGDDGKITFGFNKLNN
jgi:DNA topoisomerase III